MQPPIISPSGPDAGLQRLLAPGVSWLGEKIKIGLDAVQGFSERRNQETLGYVFPHPGMSRRESAILARDIPEYNIDMGRTPIGNEASQMVELGWRALLDSTVTEENMPGISKIRALMPDQLKNPKFTQTDITMRRVGMSMAGGFLDWTNAGDIVAPIAAAIPFLTSPMKNKWHPRNLSTWYRSIWRPIDHGFVGAKEGVERLRGNTLSRALRTIFLHHEAGPYSNNPNMPFFQMDALTSDYWLADMLNTNAGGLQKLYRGRTAIRNAVGDVSSAAKDALFSVPARGLSKDPARYQMETFFRRLTAPIYTDDELDELWQIRYKEITKEYFGALADHPELARPYNRPRTGAEYTPNVTSSTPSQYLLRGSYDFQRTPHDAERIIQKVRHYEDAVNLHGQEFVDQVLSVPLDHRTPAWYEKLHEHEGWQTALSSLEGRSVYEFVPRVSREDMVVDRTYKAMTELQEQTSTGGKVLPYKSKVLRDIMTNNIDALPMVPKPPEWLHYTTSDMDSPASAQAYDELMTEFLHKAIFNGVVGDNYKMAELAASDVRYRDLFLNPANNDGSMLLAYLQRADIDYLRKLEVERAAMMTRKDLPYEPVLTGRYPLIIMPDGTTGGFPIRHNAKYDAANPTSLPFTFPTGGVTGERVNTELNRLHEVLAWSEGAGGLAPNEVLGAKKATQTAQLIDQDIEANRRLLKFTGAKKGVQLSANATTPLAYDFRLGKVYNYTDTFEKSANRFRNMISSAVGQNQQAIEDLNPLIDQYLERAFAVYSREHLLDTGRIRVPGTDIDPFKERIAGIMPQQVEQVLQRIRTKNLSEPIAQSQMEIRDSELFTAIKKYNPNWSADNEATFFEVLKENIEKAPKADLIGGDKVIAQARQAALAIAGSSEKPTRELLDMGAIINLTSPYLDAHTGSVWGYMIKGMVPEGAGRIAKSMQDLNARSLTPIGVMSEETGLSDFAARSRAGSLFVIDYGIHDLFSTPKSLAPTVVVPDVLRVSSSGNSKGLFNLIKNMQGEYTTVFRDPNTAVLDVAISRWPAFFVFQTAGFNPLVLDYSANFKTLSPEIEKVIAEIQTDVLKGNIVSDPTQLKVMPSEQYGAYIRQFASDPSQPSFNAAHAAQSGIVPPGGYIIDLGRPTSPGGWTAKEIQEAYSKRMQDVVLSMPRQMIQHYEQLAIPEALHNGDHIQDVLNVGVVMMRDIMPYHEAAVIQDSVARFMIDVNVRRLMEASELKSAGKISPQELDEVVKVAAEDFDGVRLHMEGVYLNNVAYKAQRDTAARALEMVKTSQKTPAGTEVTKVHIESYVDALEQEAYTKLESAMTDIDDTVTRFIQHPENANAWKPQLMEGTAEKLAAETGQPLGSLKRETVKFMEELDLMSSRGVQVSPSIFKQGHELQTGLMELQLHLDKLPRWGGMQPLEKAQLRENIVSLYEQVRGQTRQFQLDIYRYHLRELRKETLGDPLEARKFMARRMAGRAELTTTPLMIAVAKQYFTPDADEDQVEAGRTKLASLHALGRITPDEYETGIRYSDNYKLMETSDMDPVQAYQDTWQDLPDQAKRLLEITMSDRTNPMVQDYLIPMLKDEEFAKRYIDYVIEASNGSTELVSWRMFHNLGIDPTVTATVFAGPRPATYNDFLKMMHSHMISEMAR